MNWYEINKKGLELGRALGEIGRDAFQTHILTTATWDGVQSRSATININQLMENTKNAFPSIYTELLGLAEGLQVPFPRVFAWNCRGEIWANTYDGCTTVYDGKTLGHNEDGMPQLRDQCFIAETSNGFSFAYPGSILGHSFAVTARGMVQMVNNISLHVTAPEIPRMVLARAVLDGGIDDAKAVLHNAPSAGFHMTLTQGTRIVSIEYGGYRSNCTELAAPFVHANHALRLGHSQTITQSSSDRQQDGEALLGKQATLQILRDQTSSDSPIFRTDPNDSDDGNTIASLLVDNADRTWEIHGYDSAEALYAGNINS